MAMPNDPQNGNDRQHTRLQDGVTRRDFLQRSSTVAAAPLLSSAVLASAPLASAPSPSPPPPPRPNLIVIISDQFRWACLGANGRNPQGLTPNLDAMARTGTNFANAITNQPVCAPSRGCLFTGQYATRHGVWHNGLPLPTESVTIAKTLRGAGYSANYVGKWHLAPED